MKRAEIFVTVFVLALLAGIFLFGCVSQGGETASTPTPQPTEYAQATATPKPVSEQAAEECISACLNAKQENRAGWENGPCLVNPLSGSLNDWVCDVAHSPREAVDNLPENQCSAYREGLAHRFVEVDTECTLITTV
jgi:hypothetical protein